jgi:tryptophanyl-tRNA synthetase
MINTIVSGIRASGKLHIGNYLGALKQFVELQNSQSSQCYFFIADLHALTTPFKPQELSQNTLDVAADYLAAGIDPQKSVFFIQAHVPAHTQLSWIFESITPLGELKRMTQFKDKSKQHPENIDVGLLTYPCLMAADILLYKATTVPVGEDQKQHVEMTRIIARKFNSRFGETFPEPKTFELKPLRVRSLTDPEKKMSKTPHQNKFSTRQVGDDGAIFLDDKPEEIKRKFKKAVTATEGKQKSLGVENLFLLLEHFGTSEQKTFFAEQLKDNTIQFSQLKDTLATDIALYFKEFREKKKQLLAKPQEIIDILNTGAMKAQETAAHTIAEVKSKIGLI